MKEEQVKSGFALLFDRKKFSCEGRTFQLQTGVSPRARSASPPAEGTLAIAVHLRAVAEGGVACRPGVIARL